jgi:hypothetical protein
MALSKIGIAGPHFQKAIAEESMLSHVFTSKYKVTGQLHNVVHCTTLSKPWQSLTGMPLMTTM